MIRAVFKKQKTDTSKQKGYWIEKIKKARERNDDKHLSFKINNLRCTGG